MTVDEQRIRDFAYQIWESEGRPDGQEQRHWAMATKLAEAADAAARSLPSKRSGKARGETLAMDPAPSPIKGKPAQLNPVKKTAKKTGKALD